MIWNPEQPVEDFLAVARLAHVDVTRRSVRIEVQRHMRPSDLIARPTAVPKGVEVGAVPEEAVGFSVPHPSQRSRSIARRCGRNDRSG